MNNPVLLDSSAWFALAEGEPGAEEVEAFLAQAWDGQMVIHASFVTLVELEYIRTHELGAMSADKLRVKPKEKKDLSVSIREQISGTDFSLDSRPDPVTDLFQGLHEDHQAQHISEEGVRRVGSSRCDRRLFSGRGLEARGLGPERGHRKHRR